MPDTVETEMQSLATSCREDVAPVRPDLGDIARRARRQRRRRTVLPLAGVVVAVVAGGLALQLRGGASSSSLRTGESGPTPAPVLTTGAGRTTATAPTTTAEVVVSPVDPTTTVDRPAPTAPPVVDLTTIVNAPGGPPPACTREGLRTGYDDTGGSGMNQHYVVVILTNTGPAPCTMPTGLRLQFLAGDRVVATAVPATAPIPPFPVDPGATASFVVHTFNPEVVCPGEPATDTTTLRIGLSPTLQLDMAMPLRAVFCDSGAQGPDVFRPIGPGSGAM